MRTRTSVEHQAAVTRRLELLSAELARAGAVPLVDREPARVPETERSAGEPESSPAAPGPGRVPIPGRHAARRPRPPVSELLPEPLRGRVGLGPGQVAVVAVLVAVGLAVTCWWVVRADSREVTRPAPPVSPLTSVSSSPEPLARAAGSAGPTAAPTSVTIDVAGKVRRPGIVVLDPGARVADALAAAGGARRGVDLTALNLARVLTDGEQVLVGITPPPGVAATADPGGDAGSGDGALVSLNTAGPAELETLPGVGPVTAQAILDWRTEHGGFTAIDELLEVDGIGEVTLGQIAPHVTL